MVEENSRGEQSVGSSRATLGSPDQEKRSLKNSFIHAVRGWREMFASSKGRKDKDVTSKEGIGTKKISPALVEGFRFRGMNLKSINRILLLILISLMGANVYVALQQQPDPSAVIKMIAKIKFQEFVGAPIESFQDMSFYIDEVKKRDIFNKFQEKKEPVKVVKVVEPPPPPPPPPPKITIEQRTKDIKLMGISWGDEPKVIIKNAQSQEVLFLIEGDFIKGTELKIKDIGKTEVIISYEEEEMKLF